MIVDVWRGVGGLWNWGHVSRRLRSHCHLGRQTGSQMSNMEQLLQLGKKRRDLLHFSSHIPSPLGFAVPSKNLILQSPCSV